MQRAAPAAVSIPTTTANAETMNPLFKDVVFREVFRIPATPPTADLATSLGTAVIADSDGYILTNFHVVNDADRIQAILHYGRLAEAKIVGGDLVSDIA
ncbi:MAG: trypsin-like peptidase domain-containing protein, partial [Gammaproteobacteria bacterium]